MSDDPAEDIMYATYRALCDHGYADLTMQDIADESAKSKAALHYHYESKHELLCAFLDHLHESFVERTADIDATDPAQRLLDLVDVVLEKSDDREAFETALLEIRAQAPYEPAFRERLTKLERHLIGELAETLADGQAAGVVRDDVDPDDTAHFLVTVLTGATTERVTVGRSTACTRRMLDEYVETHLLSTAEATEA